MATSGTYTFNDTVLSIISGALRKIGRLGDFETLADTDKRYLAGKAALDPIIKSYAAHGMPVWALTDLEVDFSDITTAAGATIGLSGATVTNVAPLRVLQGIRRDNTTSDTSDVLMELWTMDRWMEIPNKESTGTPIAFNYQPVGPATSTKGILKVWPLPDATMQADYSIVIRFQRPLQDAGTSGLNLDFPVEWNRCMIYTLAYDLAPEYGIDISQRQALLKDRNDLFDMAMSTSTEEGSFFIQPRKR